MLPVLFDQSSGPSIMPLLAMPYLWSLDTLIRLFNFLLIVTLTGGLLYYIIQWCRIEYRVIREIDSGSSGRVYLAKSTCIPLLTALKVFMVDPADQQSFQQEKAIHDYLGEAERADGVHYIARLDRISSRQLFTPYGWPVRTRVPIMALEYCESSLDSLVAMHVRLDPDAHSQHYIAFLLRQVIESLAFLRKKRVMHLDIKLGNFVATQPVDSATPDAWALRLIDFGHAERADLLDSSKERDFQVGTVGCIAPEIILRDPNYSFPADMFSAGILLLHMTRIELFEELDPQLVEFAGAHKIQASPSVLHLAQLWMILYPGRKDWLSVYDWPGVTQLPRYNSIHALQAKLAAFQKRRAFTKRCQKARQRLHAYLGAKGMDLLNRMLTVNPATRITPIEALKHGFFEMS